MRVTCVHMCARLLVLTKHMNHILNLLENILACTHETPFLNSRLWITGIRAMAYSLLTIKISTSQQPHVSQTASFDTTPLVLSANDC